jgi:hypothetical protein
MIVATHSLELLKRHPEARIIRLEEGMITYASWAGATIYNSTGIGYIPPARSKAAAKSVKKEGR